MWIRLSAGFVAVGLVMVALTFSYEESGAACCNDPCGIDLTEDALRDDHLEESTKPHL